MYETHGLVQTRAYNSWRGMKDRCLNPNHAGYKNYGGRGITICPRWRDSFVDFYQDMGDPPPGASLERRRNSDGYSKANCFWATRTQQARNKRNNRLITADGVTKTLAEWSELTGLNYATLITRIDRDGQSPEEALSKPAGQPKKTTRWLEHGGTRQSVAAWARQLDTSSSAILSRLKAGMTVADALTIPFGAISLQRVRRNNRMLTYAGLTLCAADWADRTGIPSTNIRQRIDAYGWSVARALTEPVTPGPPQKRLRPSTPTSTP